MNYSDICLRIKIILLDICKIITIVIGVIIPVSVVAGVILGFLYVFGIIIWETKCELTPPSNPPSPHSVACGRWPLTHPPTNPLVPARIVGGHNAVENAVPWQVSIRKKRRGSQSTKHWCGGTIISDIFILSAAHCFKNVKKSKFRIRVGDLDNRDKVKDKYEKEFEIETVHLHPCYVGKGYDQSEEDDDLWGYDSDLSNYDYDLAVIQVRLVNGQGITFNEAVYPACLPHPNLCQPHPNQLCSVSGWGEMADKSYPAILQTAEVPLISKENCSEMLESSITNRMQCAGYKNGGVDTCSGDSGGPLVCPINGRYVLYGVTAFGDGCGQAMRPGVYAKVAAMLDWVTMITGVTGDACSGVARPTLSWRTDIFQTIFIVILYYSVLSLL